MEKYANYLDSGIKWIGKIPALWKMARVKNAFVRKNSKAMQEEPTILSLARSGVKIRDVSANEGQVAESYFNYNPVLVGDLLINPMDLYSGANCNISEVEGVISPAYFNLKNKEGYNPKFFDYYFKVQYWMMVFFAHGRGVSQDNRWVLNAETLMNYPIVVPKLWQQNDIVAYLDNHTARIDVLLADLQSQSEMLDKYKRELIVAAVTKGLDKSVTLKDSGVEWIGAIPHTWSINKIRFLGTLQNGISKSGDSFGTGFPFVSYGDVYNNVTLPTAVSGLVESSVMERNLFSVKSGDVFFTRTSETVEEIGIASTCDKTICDATFAGFLIRFRPSSKLLTKDYAKYYFRSDILRKYFVKEMMIVTRASLGQNLLKNTPVPLPPVAEQEIIAEYLNEKTSKIEDLISDINEQMDKLKQYRQIVIHDAVTGKIKVSEETGYGD